MLSERRWYAVQTKSRCEDQAINWIQLRSSLPIFMPRLEVLRRRHGRAVREVEPLFPSYIFVHMGAGPEDWHAVKWAPGVKGIVSSGEIPVSVPDDAIVLLRHRCADGYIQYQLRWQSGTQVRMVHGPFAGLVGILDRPTSRRERVRVFLRLMHSTVPVEVEATDVEFAGTAHA